METYADAASVRVGLVIRVVTGITFEPLLSRAFARGASECARDRLVIRELRGLSPVRREHLRARVVERDEHASAPRVNLSDVLLERELMILDRLEGGKRHGPERHDDARAYNFNLPTQELRAVRYLLARRLAVRARLAARVAERRVRDEDFVTREADRREVAREVSARLVARERNASAVAALTPRSLAHEHHARAHAPVVRAQHRAPPAHRRAPAARRGLRHERFEIVLFNSDRCRRQARLRSKIFFDCTTARAVGRSEVSDRSRAAFVCRRRAYVRYCEDAEVFRGAFDRAQERSGHLRVRDEAEALRGLARRG